MVTWKKEHRSRRTRRGLEANYYAQIQFNFMGSGKVTNFSLPPGNESNLLTHIMHTHWGICFIYGLEAWCHVGRQYDSLFPRESRECIKIRNPALRTCCWPRYDAGRSILILAQKVIQATTSSLKELVVACRIQSVLWNLFHYGPEAWCHVEGRLYDYSSPRESRECI